MKQFVVTITKTYKVSASSRAKAEAHAIALDRGLRESEDTFDVSSEEISTGPRKRC